MSRFPKISSGRSYCTNQEGAYNVDGRGLVQTDVTTGGSVNSPRYTTYIDKDGKPGKYASMGHAGGHLPEGDLCRPRRPLLSKPQGCGFLPPLQRRHQTLRRNGLLCFPLVNFMGTDFPKW